MPRCGPIVSFRAMLGMQSVQSICQAEVHGCGDQAQRMEQKKWKEACADAWLSLRSLSICQRFATMINLSNTMKIRMTLDLL